MSLATAKAAPAGPLQKSVRRQEIAEHNEGFVDGVCHAIDEARRLGYLDAAEAMFKALFVPAPAGRG